MSAIKCFFLEPAGFLKLYLRRYRSSKEGEAPCPGKFGYHDASFYIGEGTEVRDSEGNLECGPSPTNYANDVRWPAKCDYCDYQFVAEDNRQVFREPAYRRTDTGEVLILRDAAPGAIWNASWMRKQAVDGQYLICKMPGDHEWAIDGRASNCDSPCARCHKPYSHPEKDKACQCKYPDGYIDAQPHQCWVRHGVPPDLTVDKIGKTCGAGAGSIIVPGWHGFLRNGFLTPC
jgi:hypothetical protein